MLDFSEDIRKFLNEEYPAVDIENMSVEELKQFREQVKNKRSEYLLLEMAQKTLGNAAYGAAASPFFYFFNVNLAADITGECRNLTKTMWANMEHWFHEEIWNRKDLWEKFDFALDESKHDWYRKQPVSIYSDTDSVYITYGTFFECFTDEYKKKYDTPEKRVAWILKYNKEFQDKENKVWCENIYKPRNGQSVHNFELETISRAGIYLKKKKYLKALSFSKGKFFDEPKISGTGIEIIKSTTPPLCRKILTEMIHSLLFESTEMDKETYIIMFNQKLNEFKKDFYNANVEEISQSIGIGDYDKYVLDDKNTLSFAKGCPVSIHAIARYNYLANKNNESNKCLYSGKIKYYNIHISGRGNKSVIGYFGYPIGELPVWAPQIDLSEQWRKTIVDPLNRFLEVMQLPLINESGIIQLSLF